MYPEDRVLVGVMPHPDDLEIARVQQWYRVPASRAPSGIHAEYIAFYFTKKFGPDLQYGIHFYARRTGHELLRRKDLLPDEINHPRAEETYYKIQLGPLRQKIPPILSLRWRRVTFIQTTWDRFTAATEINDLFSTDHQFVDRVYHALKMRGIQPDRDVEIREGDRCYKVEILIPCKDGAVMLASGDQRPAQALRLSEEMQDLEAVEAAIHERGGPRTIDAGW
jgi:hypothetical protein